jgi:uncharacterized DUF497 family protein
MKYEWDPIKNDENFQKHGLSLAEGIPALQDPAADFWIDDRYA